MIPAALVAALFPVALGPDWQTHEARHLTNHQQLTFPQDYTKAGEAYFDPAAKFIVFQAIQRPAASAAADAPDAAPAPEPDPFYAMFVARLDRALKPNGTHFSLSDTTRISPPSSANTCGWFHPTEAGVVVMGSTLTRPSDEQKSGFQVGSRRYVWMFPAEMEVVTVGVPAINSALNDPALGRDPRTPVPVFSRPTYDAECSYDPTGRFVLYTHVEEESTNAKPDGNIYIFDTKTKQHHAIVVAPGYDGGAFFSPDATSICYRSDRKGDDLLQLFVADLKFTTDDAGSRVPVAIEREWQITDNQHVNWAPYWHPDGKTLVYASSAEGHTNYEIFAATLDWAALRALPNAPSTNAASTVRLERITHAPGADILPAFTPDGEYLMWTSQRGQKLDSETRPSSQLWIARWKP